MRPYRRSGKKIPTPALKAQIQVFASLIDVLNRRFSAGKAVREQFRAKAGSLSVRLRFGEPSDNVAQLSELLASAATSQSCKIWQTTSPSNCTARYSAQKMILKRRLPVCCVPVHAQLNRGSSMDLNEGQLFDPSSDFDQWDRTRPHRHQPLAVCFLTMRLNDSIPKSVVQSWHRQRLEYLARHGVDCSGDWKVGLQSMTPEQLEASTSPGSASPCWTIVWGSASWPTQRRQKK